MDARFVSPCGTPHSRPSHSIGADLPTSPATPGRGFPWQIAALRLALVLSVFVSAGATYTTPNFVVTAPTPEFAKQVGDLAEEYRDQIAMQWLGQKLRRWYKPCPIHCKVGQLGAGGATSFCFDRGEVFGWKMNIQGSEERILDSVLPHEVSHTIFACHFRRPLPRWADEGAATLVEHESERHRQQMLLDQVIRTSKRIPLKQLLGMKEYPKEMQQVLTLYAEGYSLANFLVQQGGRKRYLQFLEDAHNRGWDTAISTHYNLKNTDALEQDWHQWVFAGSPPLARRDGAQLADAGKGRKPNDPVFRSQNPEDATGDHLDAPARTPTGDVTGRERQLPLASAGAGGQRRSDDNAAWDRAPSNERQPRPIPLPTRVAASGARSPQFDDRPAVDDQPLGKPFRSQPSARRMPVEPPPLPQRGASPPFEDGQP